MKAGTAGFQKTETDLINIPSTSTSTYISHSEARARGGWC